MVLVLDKEYKYHLMMQNGRMCFMIILLAPLFMENGRLMAQDAEVLVGCDCPIVRIDDAFCAATWVFEGVPLSSDTTFSTGDQLEYPRNTIDHVDVLFDVSRWLKGVARKKVIVSTSFERDECAFRFILGQEYLVFAHQEEGLIVTDRCDPTRESESIGRSFADSLEYVRSGHQWEGHVPLTIPCN